MFFRKNEKKREKIAICDTILQNLTELVFWEIVLFLVVNIKVKFKTENS